MKNLFLILLLLFTACGHASTSWTKTDNDVPIELKISKTTEADKLNFGTVILLHGCGGVSRRDENFANILVSENFNVVRIDSWKYRNMPDQRGPDSVCLTYSVKANDRLEEVNKTTNWIKRQSWHKGDIFIVGWSHGGMTALAASVQSLDNGIKKSVSFYPYCIKGQWSNPSIPIQLHIGKDDNWTPASLCRNLYSSVSKKSNGEIFEYENSYHGFDGFNNATVPGVDENGKIEPRIIRPNADAKKLAYERVIKFLKD